MILFKKGLIPTVTFAIALEGWFEQYIYFCEGGNTIVALSDKRNVKRHGCGGKING